MTVEVRKPTNAELEEMGVMSWPVWTCSPSVFDWSYEDRETCYILEGEVTVATPDGEVSFGKGDLVVFPEGLNCTWRVRKAVRKHYRFG